MKRLLFLFTIHHVTLWGVDAHPLRGDLNEGICQNNICDRSKKPPNETVPGLQARIHSLSTVGTVYPQHKSSLGSIVSGRIEEILVDVGDPVTKGQEIIRLDTRLFTIAVSEARQAVEAAKIELADADRNFERMKKLFEKPEGQTPSISQKRFEDAKTRYDQALIAVRRSEEILKHAEVNLQEATIRAPYNGIVSKRLVHPGEPVNAAPVTKLLEIISIDTLYVEYSVPQGQMAKVKLGSPVVLDIDGTSIAPFAASIDLILPDIDEKSRSFTCRSFVDNRNRSLYPGSLARVSIQLNPETHPSSSELAIAKD